MCGIAGIVKLAGAATSRDVAAVLSMLNGQVHRGPDDWGLLLPDETARNAEVRALTSQGFDRLSTYPVLDLAPVAILGSRRLSILDVSRRGRMPMGSSDGRIWITYNGEIYNYRELRAELEQRGFSFQSNSDTEAILHGYEVWGEDIIPRLRGMFAFAMFDLSRAGSRLILAKDRFGIKPIYYYQDHERMIFASEVRALMRSGVIPDEKNPEALAQFLRLGSVPVPQTTVKNVFAIPMGHHLTLEGPNWQRPALKQYWNVLDHPAQPKSSYNSHDFDQDIAATRAILGEAVKLHLISDVPLGIFLSGGVDSSGLVALASKASERPLTTLSVAFEEPDYNEAQYARIIAKRYRTIHREVVLSRKDFFDELPRIFFSLDQPTVDGVNTYFISRSARAAGLTVVLSGTGGDEVFWGYGHFRKAMSLDRLRSILVRVPTWLRRAVIEAVAHAGPLVRRSGLEKLSYLKKPTNENLYLLFRGLFTEHQVRDLLGTSEWESKGLASVLHLTESSVGRSIIDSLTAFEFTHYLQNQLLRDTDLMSMAHSVEARVPFLDHQLVEHVLRLPATAKLHHTINKPLLVNALRDELPRDVWDRPKMGFTLPFAEWLKTNSAELEAAVLRRKLFRRATVEAIWKGFKGGRVHWSRPWALMVATQSSSV
jgi:asparagine synthase (glutamine-hydrolysing)